MSYGYYLMSSRKLTEIAARPDQLKFLCGHCGGMLEVPLEMAGVSGPCPLCQAHITAPVPVFELPEPPAHPMPAVSALEQGAAPRVRRRRHKEKALGYFADDTARVPMLDSGYQIESRAGRGWFDYLLVAIFAGTVLTAGAALVWTTPRLSEEPVGMPEGLSALVSDEVEAARLERAEAVVKASILAEDFLSAAGSQEAKDLLVPVVEPTSWPLFPSLQASHLTVKYNRRVPNSNPARYLVGLVGPGGIPELPVEETADYGVRLHAGVILQQSEQGFDKFLKMPGVGSAMLYVLAGAPHPEMEARYRRDRPDLNGYLMAEISNPFAAVGEQSALLACFAPSSPAAEAWQHRAHDIAQRRALVKMVWHRHRVAGPWARVECFLPDVWCGDPAPVKPRAPAMPVMTTAP